MNGTNNCDPTFDQIKKTIINDVMDGIHAIANIQHTFNKHVDKFDALWFDVFYIFFKNYSNSWLYQH